MNGTAPYSVKSGRVARFDEIEHQRAVDKLRNGHYKSAESQRKGNGRQLLHQGSVIQGLFRSFFQRKRPFFFPRVEKINNGENSQSHSLRQGYGKNSASHRLFYVGHEKIREVKPRSQLYYLFANLRQRGGRHVHFALKISLERAYKTHKQYGRAYQSVKNSQIGVALNFGNQVSSQQKHKRVEHPEYEKNNQRARKNALCFNCFFLLHAGGDHFAYRHGKTDSA